MNPGTATLKYEIMFGGRRSGAPPSPPTNMISYFNWVANPAGSEAPPRRISYPIDLLIYERRKEAERGEAAPLPSSFHKYTNLLVDGPTRNRSLFSVGGSEALRAASTPTENKHYF